MSLFNSISSFFDDLTTTRRHATKKRPSARSSSPSHLPIYTPPPPARNSIHSNPTASRPSWEAPLPNTSRSNLPILRLSATDKKAGIPLHELSPHGVQPAAPVRESWARIDKWTEGNYPELYDQLCASATTQDVDDLEAELECLLPSDVRESLYVHDGQDRGGKPTGILFGVTLLDCEEIAEEWQLWKRVAQAYNRETSPVSSPLSSIPTPQSTVSEPPSSRPRMAKRNSRIFGPTTRFHPSHPPDTIQKVYAHAHWIPLAKDFSGNNIAVDLCPGPRGVWGQVILFGRECETKYVVARSWAAFLSAIADDFEAGEARFAEELKGEGGGGELRIRICPGARDDSFLEVLKARVRMREREIYKRRQEVKRRTTGQPEIGKRSPVGFPSPSLPRPESAVSTPVIASELALPQQPSVTDASVHDSEIVTSPVATTPVTSSVVRAPVSGDRESGTTTDFSSSKDGDDSVESQTDVEDEGAGLGIKE
jgi:cell wall assembly regulator SMI1